MFAKKLRMIQEDLLEWEEEERFKEKQKAAKKLKFRKGRGLNV